MTRRRDHVLLITNNFPPVRGGSAVVYRELARRSKGRLHVLAPSNSYDDGLPLIGWREYDRTASHPTHRLPLLRTPLMKGAPSPGARLKFAALELWLRARLLTRIASLLRHEPIGAICIGELISSGWLLQWLRYYPRLRRIAYVHGEEITTDDGYDPKGARRRAPLASADGIVVVSRFTDDAVHAMFAGSGFTPATRLIGNGVDFPRFAQAEPRPDLVSAYGLDDRFVFLSVCRLLEKKGIDHAIRAFARLHRIAPDCRFLVVGTGAYSDRLAAIAVEEGVDKAVIFAGDVPDDDLPAHYRLGDVFVMPNRRLPSGDTEGFGLVFLEANAAGLPVIAGNAGGSRDAVTDGVNGLVVDGQSVEAIETAMRRLYEDAALRDRLAEGGLARAAAEDWGRKAEEFIDLCVNAQSGGDPEPIPNPLRNERCT